MVKIVVDTFGGDEGVAEIVKGVVDAVNNDKDVTVILVGKELEIATLLGTHSYDKQRIEIVDAKDTITNEDVPTVAIRQKTDSTLVKALDILKGNDDVAGLLSVGSTGALLTGAFMKIGRIKGVSRPAMSAIVPTVTGGHAVLMDCGANMDSKPINLVHFALMGNAYIKSEFGVEKPRIALLSVGTEDKKGNELTHEAFAMLKGLDIEFVGNMEARDFLSGKYDLVVADGFAGNVLLKSTEGAIGSLLHMMKQEIKAGFWSKVGALFLKKVFKKIKGKLDYNQLGGAIFVGTKKLVMKAHGACKSTSITKSIEDLCHMHKNDLLGKISEELAKCDFSAEE